MKEEKEVKGREADTQEGRERRKNKKKGEIPPKLSNTESSARDGEFWHLKNWGSSSLWHRRQQDSEVLASIAANILKEEHAQEGAVMETEKPYRLMEQQEEAKLFSDRVSYFLESIFSSVYVIVAFKDTNE